MQNISTHSRAAEVCLRLSSKQQFDAKERAIGYIEVWSGTEMLALIIVQIISDEQEHQPLLFRHRSPRPEALVAWGKERLGLGEQASPSTAARPSRQLKSLLTSDEMFLQLGAVHNESRELKAKCRALEADCARLEASNQQLVSAYEASIGSRDEWGLVTTLLASNILGGLHAPLPSGACKPAGKQGGQHNALHQQAGDQRRAQPCTICQLEAAQQLAEVRQDLASALARCELQALELSQHSRCSGRIQQDCDKLRTPITRILKRLGSLCLGRVAPAARTMQYASTVRAAAPRRSKVLGEQHELELIGCVKDILQLASALYLSSAQHVLPEEQPDTSALAGNTAAWQQMRACNDELLIALRCIIQSRPSETATYNYSALSLADYSAPSWYQSDVEVASNEWEAPALHTIPTEGIVESTVGTVQELLRQAFCESKNLDETLLTLATKMTGEIAVLKETNLTLCRRLRTLGPSLTDANCSHTSHLAASWDHVKNLSWNAFERAVLAVERATSALSSPEFGHESTVSDSKQRGATKHEHALAAAVRHACELFEMAKADINRTVPKISVATAEQAVQMEATTKSSRQRQPQAPEVRSKANLILEQVHVATLPVVEMVQQTTERDMGFPKCGALGAKGFFFKSVASRALRQLLTSRKQARILLSRIAAQTVQLGSLQRILYSTVHLDAESAANSGCTGGDLESSNLSAQSHPTSTQWNFTQPVLGRFGVSQVAAKSKLASDEGVPTADIGVGTVSTVPQRVGSSAHEGVPPTADIGVGTVSTDSTSPFVICPQHSDTAQYRCLEQHAVHRQQVAMRMNRELHVAQLKICSSLSRGERRCEHGRATK